MTAVDQVSVTRSPLDATLREAVTEGIITAEQADQIAILEAGRQVPGAGEAPRGGRLRPLVAEAVGYVGGALAMLAAFILAAEFWADLQPWARVALLAVAATGLLAAGVAARAERGPVDRLRGFLWMLSAAAVAGTVGVGLVEYTGLEGEPVTLAAGTAVVVYGGALWRARVAGLQQLVVLAGAVVALAAGLAVVDAALADWIGLAVWAVGVAWALLAWAGRIQPAAVGLAAGALLAVLAPATGAGAALGWLLGLGLVTAVGLAAASIPLRQMLPLALGIFGLVVYVPRIIFEYFEDTLGAPVSLLLTGIVLVAVAVVLARVRPGAGAGELR